MEMKTIIYRGGVLKFRIPATWVEEYSDVDGGMFYEDGPDTGTFRVKIISLSKPQDSKQISLRSLLEPMLRGLGKSEKDVQYVGDNGLLRYEEAAIEEGTELRIHYWVFVNPINSFHARVANFSYTVLDALRGEASTQRELETLDREIVKTEFATEVGV